MQMKLPAPLPLEVMNKVAVLWLCGIEPGKYKCSAVQCSAVLEGFRTIGRKTIQYQLTPLGTVRTRRKRENFGKHVCVGFG